MKIFGLLSSKNYATMGTWHNDFSSLYIAMHLSNLFLKRPVKSQDFYNFECKLKILHCTEILYVYFFSPTKLWSGTCGTSLSIVAATNRLKNSKRALGISTRQFVRSARKRTLQNKNKVVSKWEKHMLLKLNIYTCINVQCTCNGKKPNLNLSLSQASLSP